MRDHQRDAPARRREQDHVIRAVELAGQADALGVEQAADDREGLREARDAAVIRDAEGVELAPVPAGAEAEDEAPAADLVDRRRHLGDQPRRVKAGAGDQRPDRHARRGRGQRGHQRPRLPRPAVLIEQVVADPDRVEPDLLGGARHVQVLGPAHDALDLRELDADAHSA
jgi:hypothetical protein